MTLVDEFRELTVHYSVYSNRAKYSMRRSIVSQPVVKL
jgi:hypothetical protein